jgi:hypothetical protein
LLQSTPAGDCATIQDGDDEPPRSSAPKKEVRLNYPVEIMKFTLLYDGSLPAQTSHDARVEDKQRIRRELHSQLVDVWQSKPMLAKHIEAFRKATPEQRAWTSNATHPDDAFFMQQFERGNFKFVPLVTARTRLICELDILFLRAEPAGALFTTNKAGDLDNRLKVLFDALRVPQEAQEIPAGAIPDATEDPFLCLLENDNLITAVRLESERLYGPASQRDCVRLVIKVTVKAQQFSWNTLDIAND